MFVILSSAFRTATREDVWANKGLTPQDNAMMAELERHADTARGRWRSTKVPTKR